MKDIFRAEFAKEWHDNRDREGSLVWEAINQPSTKKFLQGVMAQLSGKAKGKAKL